MLYADGESYISYHEFISTLYYEDSKISQENKKKTNF